MNRWIWLVVLLMVMAGCKHQETAEEVVKRMIKNMQKFPPPKPGEELCEELPILDYDDDGKNHAKGFFLEICWKTEKVKK